MVTARPGKVATWKRIGGTDINTFSGGGGLTLALVAPGFNLLFYEWFIAEDYVASIPFYFKMLHK